MKRGPKQKVEGEQTPGVAPVPGEPTIPKTLDKIGRAKWRDIVAALGDLGILSRTDGDIIEQYCSTYARWHRAESVIVKGELTYTSASGMARPLPEIAIADTSSKQLKSLLETMGLTPASRARVNATPSTEEADAEWSEFA